MNFTIQKLLEEKKIINITVKWIMVAIIIFCSTHNASAVTTLLFNDTSTTLLMDFTNSTTQSFFVNVPNEYVLSASMDMEGQPTISQLVPPNKSDVVIVTDVSGSMNDSISHDSEVTKLEQAQNASKGFVYYVNTSYIHIGLVKYASCPTIGDVLQLTNNTNILLTTITNYRIESSTNIGGGLDLAVDELISSRAQPGVKKYVILLTDGQANHYYDGTDCIDVGNEDPYNAAANYLRNISKRAAANGVIVYTIGLGQSVSASLLTEVANNTGGKYFSTTTGDELQAIYQMIAQSISTYAYPTPQLMTTLANGSELGWRTNTTLNRNVTWLDEDCGLEGANCTLFTNFIQDALNSCFTDMCRVDLRVESITSGKILLSNFKIKTIKNGNCGKVNCMLYLNSGLFNIDTFANMHCTDGTIRVEELSQYSYVHYIYPSLSEIKYNVSSFTVKQPVSGNFIINPSAGNRTTRYSLSSVNVSDADRGVGVISIALPRVNRPMTFCPILLKQSPYNPIGPQDIITELLVTSSRAATGYNSGDFEAQGSYIFTAKVWLRK